MERRIKIKTIANRQFNRSGGEDVELHCRICLGLFEWSRKGDMLWFCKEAAGRCQCVKSGEAAPLWCRRGRQRRGVGMGAARRPKHEVRLE